MQLEAEFALASEATDRVDAMAVVTRIASRVTAFIDVLTTPSIGSDTVTCSTITLEAALCVHAVSWAAQLVILHTFININTDHTVSIVSGFTLASVRANGVHTFCVQVTLTQADQTFINVFTFISITIVSLFTLTRKTPDIVETSGIGMATTVLFTFAFININAYHGVCIKHISLFTLTKEGTNRIDATAVHASMLILPTLVNVDTGFSIK